METYFRSLELSIPPSKTLDRSMPLRDQTFTNPSCPPVANADPIQLDSTQKTK